MCYAPFVPYALADGLTVVLPEMDFSKPASADPERIVEAIEAYKCACAFASPILWSNLVRHCEKKRVRLSTLTHAVTAGAPVPAGLHRRLRGILPEGGQLYTPYGATEAMPITASRTATLEPTWEKSRAGFGTCVGTPVTAVDARLC